jgi:hypothetical protein
MSCLYQLVGRHTEVSEKSKYLKEIAANVDLPSQAARPMHKFSMRTLYDAHFHRSQAACATEYAFTSRYLTAQLPRSARGT